MRGDAAAIADLIKAKAQPIYTMLDRKYWMDDLFQFLFAGGWYH